MKTTLLLLLALSLSAPAVRADDDTSLTRDEVASFKKKLATVLDALGVPPAGWVKEKDDFQLPTDYTKEDGKVSAVTASVSRHLAIAGVKASQKGNEQLGQDFQKKMLEAQAKGDYAELARLSQQVQQQSSANALAGVQAQQDKKEPIEVRVGLNESVDEAIDPDGVVVEKPGVIGLRRKDGGDDAVKETLRLYFQPALKDTKKLSRVRLFTKGTTVPSKTSVGTAYIELTGPVEAVEAWAKRVNVAKALSVVDAPAP